MIAATGLVAEDQSAGGVSDRTDWSQPWCSGAVRAGCTASGSAMLGGTSGHDGRGTAGHYTLGSRTSTAGARPKRVRIPRPSRQDRGERRHG
jgi:hypothetical protein